jgi:cytidine deaminase
MINDETLIQRAKDCLNPMKLSRNSDSGGVSSALVTDKGHVYVGVCIDTASSMKNILGGFSANSAPLR